MTSTPCQRMRGFKKRRSHGVVRISFLFHVTEVLMTMFTTALIYGFGFIIGASLAYAALFAAGLTILYIVRRNKEVTDGVL